MNSIDEIKKEIKNKKIVLQQLEGVLRTSTNELQKKKGRKRDKGRKRGDR